jgi:hypothetical protein
MTHEDPVVATRNHTIIKRPIVNFSMIPAVAPRGAPRKKSGPREAFTRFLFY